MRWFEVPLPDRVFLLLEFGRTRGKVGVYARIPDGWALIYVVPSGKLREVWTSIRNAAKWETRLPGWTKVAKEMREVNMAGENYKVPGENGWEMF